ncbi:SHOCT domain-containing protein [Enterococcus faecalis]|nr:MULTISPECIES: SHOCT domain-containing protein [Enterococcus]MDI7020403.1 SHOCT domain-containing protein [Enterococcus faecalis]MDK8195298.1 SHOCT domain-containing protein [Enterococcus faecalis]MDK8204583.1 SHOCT domain-containing protein [Enterococcus faecalis]MDK8220073.1 SHOCT domain-containing protein [Enterococcus faecalis]MDK8221233.1 SHOCT domain-containing protein [Enterococcus faecalis]
MVVAPPTQLAAAHSVAAVEVFRFFAEIPTPINQPIEPKLSDSQKNSSSTIEDVMAELRNLKMLVDEGVLTEEEFQQKKRQLLQLD